MRIFTFHLLNDYSGSPKVLSQLLKHWGGENREVYLYTGKGRTGFLSNIEGVNYRYFNYRFAENKWVRLFNLLLSQFQLFCMLFFKLKKGDIVYVNTVLPFGAAIAGKMRGVQVIYHIHETTMKPPILKKLLFGFAKLCSTKVIFVSSYLKEKETFGKELEFVVYNALEQSFFQKALQERKDKKELRNVLMVCSLKTYKGVDEFVKLAQNQVDLSFRLVVNATQTEVNDYFKGQQLPSNLELFTVQTNLHPFYQWADLIVNFSIPSGWVETFGLTIIEGMAYALPAIVPVVGGIIELVENEVNGFRVDAQNQTALNATVEHLKDESVYQALSLNSKELIKKYIEIEMFNNVDDILTK